MMRKVKHFKYDLFFATLAEEFKKSILMQAGCVCILLLIWLLKERKESRKK